MPQTLNQELADIHRELATYGRKGPDVLTKALRDTDESLRKAKKPPMPPEDDENEDDMEDEDDGGDEDEDEGGDEEGDEDEEDAPPPPAKKAPPFVKKSKTVRRTGADEQFLKSLLFDDVEEGDEDIRGVIEATPVLSHMADQFAKSLGLMDEQIGGVALTLDKQESMNSAIAYAVLDMRRELKAIRKSLNSQPASQPAAGVTHNLEKSRKRAAPGENLSKSKAGDAISAAIGVGFIPEDEGSSALLTLDSQGVEGALELISNADMRSNIRQLSVGIE